MTSRNLGIEQSDSEFVAFTDSDCTVDGHWLPELIEPFRLNSRTMIVGGDILDDPISHGNYWLLVGKWQYRFQPDSGYVPYVLGGNMAFRREFLRRHPFDETLKYGSDEIDLCLEATSEGSRIYFQRSAQVVHYHRRRFAEVVEQRYRLGLGNAYIRLKHHVWPPLSMKSCLMFSCLSLASTRTTVGLAVAAICAIAFLTIVIMEDLSSGIKTAGEIMLSVPGRVVMAIADSVGYAAGAVRFAHMLPRSLALMTKRRLRPQAFSKTKNSQNDPV